MASFSELFERLELAIETLRDESAILSPGDADRVEIAHNIKSMLDRLEEEWPIPPHS